MRTTAVMIDSDEAAAEVIDAKATAAAVFTFAAAVALFVWAPVHQRSHREKIDANHPCCISPAGKNTRSFALGFRAP